jgi:hypothetical protein
MTTRPQDGLPWRLVPVVQRVRIAIIVAPDVRACRLLEKYGVSFLGIDRHGPFSIGGTKVLDLIHGYGGLAK